MSYDPDEGNVGFFDPGDDPEWQAAVSAVSETYGTPAAPESTDWPGAPLPGSPWPGE
ncbi:hypothetical protein GCM10009639_34870 [Kitasatospora putterlickiae]|uniref:Uncharacterized protein n=1 Tax=Kitasatospora putterlickiae TaxID=221725 RepID=A0ABP4IX83_9ACTN